MSFGTERTTDYHLTEAIITSDRTITGIDIFKNVNSMKIFEHIEKPYLTMVLSFADEENVVQDMDFQGGEKISITLIDAEEIESALEIKKQFDGKKKTVSMADLIVLAGFMRILTPVMIEAFKNKIINI